MTINANEIKCIICRGVHFRKGYFEAEYEKYDEYYKENGNSEAEVYLMLTPEEKNTFSSHEYTKYYTYVCEECGFIMNFTKEKIVESKKDQHEREEKARTYDWTNFK